MRLKGELRATRRQNAQLKKELTVVDAYIKLEEEGRSVHEIIEDNVRLEAKCQKMQRDLLTVNSRHESALEKEREKVKEVGRVLRDQ